MNSSSLFSRPVRVVKHAFALSASAFVLGIGVLPLRAELIIEHERGGLNRYGGIGGPVGAGFSLTEAVRIEAVTAWMNGDGLVNFGLSGGPPETDPVGFAKAFNATPAPYVPAKWQGVNGLKWDLQPGNYFISFDDGQFPRAYGGPPSTAPQDFDSFQYYDGRWIDLGFPLGIRVYGTPLSAVPEPSTYGALAGLALIGLAYLRKRTQQRA